MESNAIVRLNIMSWVDSCAIGASHYYAKLLYNPFDWERKQVMTHIDKAYEEFELEYVLDEEGAKRLTFSEPDDAPPYKAGDTTHRFLCPGKLREEALKQWRKVVPHGKVLVVSDWASCGPCEILAGPKKLVRLGNQVWKKWDVSEANDKLCIQLERQWEALFKKAGFR